MGVRWYNVAFQQHLDWCKMRVCGPGPDTDLLLKPMDFAQIRISAWMSMLQRGHVFDACIRSICKPQIVENQLVFVAFSEIGLGLR